MVKNYPLQFEEKELDEIRALCRKLGKSIKLFFREAIQEKIIKEGVNIDKN